MPEQPQTTKLGRRSSPSPPTRPAMKKRSTRGSGFTSLEDAALAKAWVSVSESAIVVTDQKGEDFYQGIADQYKKFYKPKNRSHIFIISHTIPIPCVGIYNPVVSI